MTHRRLAIVVAAVLPFWLAAAPATKPATQPSDRPAPKLARSGQLDPSYAKRHDQILAERSTKPQLLFLGASVIERWQTVGKDVYHAEFDKYAVTDDGVGGDKTQHILWRIDHGELDGTAPRVVVFNTGNNIDDDSAAANFAGFKAIADAVHAKLPRARVLVVAMLPRGVDPATSGKIADRRAKTKALNAALKALDDGDRTRVLDLTDTFLDARGVQRPGLMGKDTIHPTAAGYRAWADAMRPVVEAMMAAPPIR